MASIGALLGLVLLIFELLLIARLVLDWVGVLAPGGGPGITRAAHWSTGRPNRCSRRCAG
jgi:YggT family protein